MALTTAIFAMLVFIFPPATIGFGTGAAVMGFVAWRRPEETTASNRGRALTAMELGIFAILWGLFWWDIANQISSNPP